MLIINVKENESIDKALRRFKKKFERTKMLRKIRAKAYYKKPTIANREARLKSAYKQKLISEQYQ